MKRIICTGGGTGGHVFPGLAVIEALQEKGEFEFIWMGSKKGIEYTILKNKNIRFKGIASGKLRRYFSFLNFLDLFKITFGFLQSFFYLLFNRPAVVFSKGGYVSVPPVLAAGILRIPVVSHESDLTPGLATKLNAPWSRKICVPFEETAKKLGSKYRAKTIVSGNPVRKDIFLGNPKDPRVPESRPLFLIIGGSMGAVEINDLVLNNLDQLCSIGTVVHQTGKEHFTGLKRENYFQFAFLGDEYPHLLAAADVVVSRSGAGGLWEIGVLTKPSVLIPKQDSGTRGEQLLNAQLFAQDGGAEILPLEGDRGKILVDMLQSFLDNPEKRSNVKSRLTSLCPVTASDTIANIILEESR